MNSQDLLRQQYIQKRKNISVSQKLQENEELLFLAKQYIQPNTTIALFAATPQEPNLIPLLHSTAASFCFPKVIDPQNGIMKFFSVSTPDDLEKGWAGILEPKEYCDAVSPEDIDLFFVPGVCFDMHGNRVGMGGGFYDRYLQKSPRSEKMGIAFSCQKYLRTLPTNPWDIPMNTVLFPSSL